MAQVASDNSDASNATSLPPHSSIVRKKSVLKCLANILNTTRYLYILPTTTLPFRNGITTFSLQHACGKSYTQASDLLSYFVDSATHILRASASGHHSHHHHPTSPDLNASLTVLHTLNRMISSQSEPDVMRTKACFILGESLLRV